MTEPTSPVKVVFSFKVVTQLGGTFDAVADDGNTIYLGIGPRLATVDVSDPTSPRLLWQSDPLPGVIGAIAVRNGVAFLNVGGKLLIYDTSDPARLTLMDPSDVSGDLLTGGDIVYSYGGNQPLLVIDVSALTNPTKKGGLLSGMTPMAVSGDVLYLVSGGGGQNENEIPDTLRLVNSTDPEETFSEIGLGAAWNYQVAASGKRAYIVENRLFTGPDRLIVLDVNDPRNPTVVTSLLIEIDQTIDGILVTDDDLFLLGRSFPHSGCPTYLYAVDIDDPRTIQHPAGLDTGSCINHFVLTGDALFVTSDRGLQIYDLRDPANIALTGELAPPDGILGVERVALDQGLAYLLTTAGRNRLHRLRALDLTGSSPALLNSDGLALEIEPSIFEGLYVRGERLFGVGPSAIDISDPADLRLAANDLGQGNSEGVFYWPPPVLVENVLYTGMLTDTPDGLRIGGGLGVVDMSDPAKPVLANEVPLEGYTVTGLSGTDRHLIVFSHKDFTRLQVFDVSDPLMPVEVSRLEPAVDPSEQVEELIVSGNTIYSAGRRGSKREGIKFTIYVLDISDPSHPAEISRFELPDDDFVTKMVADGDTIYMLVGSKILAMNVSEGSHLYPSGQFSFLIKDFAVNGDLLYLAAGDAGLYIVQVEK